MFLRLCFLIADYYYSCMYINRPMQIFSDIPKTLLPSEINFSQVSVFELNTLDSIGNCLRPVLSFGVSRDEIVQSFGWIQSFYVGLVKKIRQYFFPQIKKSCSFVYCSGALDTVSKGSLESNPRVTKQ